MLFRVLVVASLAGAYIYLTPYILANRLLTAVEARDGEFIAEYVDFEAVRESLRSQLHIYLDEDMPTHLQETILYLIAKQPPDKAMTVSAMINLAITRAGLVAFMQAMQRVSRDPKIADDLLGEVSTAWQGFSEYVIKITYRRTVKFVLTHKAIFRWRLTKVILPLAVRRTIPSY